MPPGSGPGAPAAGASAAGAPAAGAPGYIMPRGLGGPGGPGATGGQTPRTPPPPQGQPRQRLPSRQQQAPRWEGSLEDIYPPGLSDGERTKWMIGLPTSTFEPAVKSGSVPQLERDQTTPPRDPICDKIDREGIPPGWIKIGPDYNGDCWLERERDKVSKWTVDEVRELEAKERLLQRAPILKMPMSEEALAAQQGRRPGDPKDPGRNGAWRGGKRRTYKKVSKRKNKKKSRTRYYKKR